jgi:segregation and condensation protein B
MAQKRKKAKAKSEGTKRESAKADESGAQAEAEPADVDQAAKQVEKGSKASEKGARVTKSSAEQEDTAAHEEALDEKKGGSWPVDRLQPVVEALLFAAGDPVTPRKLAGCVAGASTDEVRTAIRAIQEDYASRGMRLVEVAGGWQMRTAAEFHDYVRHLFKQKQFRLTRAGIETVSIVAYKQPATRAEIEEVRGVDCSGVLESLVERGVVKVAGRRDVPGRPLVYVTTPRFLEMFGLKDLKGLPTLAELGDDIRGLADTAGFEDGDERDAAILPLEEGDGGDQAYSEDDDSEGGSHQGQEGSVPKLSFAKGGREGPQGDQEQAGDGEEEATDSEEDEDRQDGRPA